MLQISSVSKRFGASNALIDVSLEVLPGEVHGLVGENGAGKSTLVRIIAGLVTPDQGRVTMKGEPVGADPAAALKAGISSVQQELQLLTTRSVAENILLGREPRTRLGVVRRGEIRRRARTTLARLGYELDPDAPVASLPVVQRQMVEIARALGNDLSLLILDEATARLEPRDIQRLMRDIRALASRGIGVLLVSHNLDEVLSVTDRVTVLRDGRLVRMLETANTSPEELTHLMVGRELEAIEASVALEPAEPNRPTVLSITDLQLRPGATPLSLGVRSGEIVGIAGLGDSGREELMEAIFGLRRVPSRGEVTLSGRRVSTQVEAIAGGVGFVGSDRKLGLMLQRSVGDNIMAPLLLRRHAISMLRRRRYERAVRAAIEFLHIRPGDPRRNASELSGGNQQRVTIARWLESAEVLWLLSEPTRGVDVAAKAEIYKSIRSFAEQGAAVLISSSELAELLHLCDRILVMYQGTLAAALSREEATEEAITSAAFGIDRSRPDAPVEALGRVIS